MTQSSSTLKSTPNVGLLPLEFKGDKLLLVDQRRLPHELVYFDATAFGDVCFAIKDMVVRGAPSIGVCAAFGLALEAGRLAAKYDQKEGAGDSADFLATVDNAGQVLKATRPTAVNLAWAVDRIYRLIKKSLAEKPSDCRSAARAALEDAVSILDEHIENNRLIGQFGSELVGQDFQIITHCNAGSLATCGWGTALGVIRSAQFAGKNVAVFVDETRPRNQGASLTMYELTLDKIPATLVCDNMAGHIMQRKNIGCVVVGADRIAANGDTANKIGTYNLAVIAHYHGVPFYVAAPLSTFDPAIADGSMIPIEERDIAELVQVGGRSHTVEGAAAYNPAFDVTPAKLISAIITEKGILRAPYVESIGRLFPTK